MGGGDLNLKKSWHPSTLRNIERVWKAEQKHEVEKQKIEQLQRELAEERAREEIRAYAEDQGVLKKKEERLDWMYQGPAAMVNRDDYLMGRKIDKTFELLQQQEIGVEPPKSEGFDVGATMFSSQDLSGTATVDLANKIREDPLFSIMKKEKEQRKNLLTNPVKMKQLQQLLQESLGKKKVKKSKKDKKRHSESDSDNECHRRRRKESKREESQMRQASQYEHEHRQRPSKKKFKDYHYKNQFSNYDDSKYKESRYSSSHKKETHNDSANRKLDADEKKRRLQEMQENAKWREEQQKRNAKRYKDDDDKECIKMIDRTDFLKPMLAAAGKGSVENRIKQKLFTIQRKSSDMNKNFARR